MTRIAGEIVIQRPVDEVFDFVADQRHEPEFNPAMVRSELVSNEPIGLGATFRAAVKSFGGTLDMTIEYTEFDRPSRLSSRTLMASAETEGTLTFEPLGEATRMRWRWDVKPRGLLKLMTPLVGWMGRRQEKAIWGGLKRRLEGEASAEGGGEGRQA
ncbi:MAG: SRPBCC family protein [Myxococcales bacterium]|nr:SRPBCC family protein [Myxococcales bacterium]